MDTSSILPSNTIEHYRWLIQLGLYETSVIVFSDHPIFKKKKFGLSVTALNSLQQTIMITLTQ